MLAGLLGRVTGQRTRATGAEGSDDTERTLRALFVVLLVDVVGFGLVIPLLPFYAEELGASALVVGLLFASFAVAQLVGVPLLGYYSDRLGRRSIPLLSLVGSMAAFILLAVAGGLPLLFLSRVSDGGTGGNITTVRAAVVDAAAHRLAAVAQRPTRAGEPHPRRGAPLCALLPDHRLPRIRAPRGAPITLWPRPPPPPTGGPSPATPGSPPG